MKTAMRMWILAMLSILVILIMGTTIQKTRAKSELRSVVSDALVQTSTIFVDERYEISKNEEFMAEFEQNLFRAINPTIGTELNIYYLNADTEKGIISVFVEEKIPFVFFPQRTFTATTQQSVIIDKTQTSIVWYDIRYHNVALNELPDGTPFVHTDGEETILVNPIREGKTFSHWEDKDGNTLTSIPSTHKKAIDLYAVWK